jgi:hypothetical protein
MKTALRYFIAPLFVMGVLFLIESPLIYADLMPPPSPERPAELRHKTPPVTIPGYSIGAGIVGVTLTGSWIALRIIRKRNGK